MKKGTLLSLNKPTTSSGKNSQLANDGNTSNEGGYFDSELHGGRDAWWQVDLGGIYSLTSVVSRNYVDGVRYYHYYVRLSSDGYNWSAPIAWKFNNNPAEDAGEQFEVTGTGRYVRVNIVKSSANMSAHLTNFEVYGYAATQPTAPQIIVECNSSEPAYKLGDEPVIEYSLTNASDSNVTIMGAYVIIFGLTDPSYRRIAEIETNLNLEANATYIGTSKLWLVDNGMPPGAYGIFIRTTLSDGRSCETYQSFFRIVDGVQLLLYKIGYQDYKGIAVYTLDGGLSAEYAVLKSVQILSQSAGPAWTPSRPGYGPNPVYATPHFLRETVAQTIRVLDSALGEERVFDSLNIAPGIQSSPHLIQTLQGPVLPLHFLVSFDSVYELRTVLKQAEKDGYRVFATFAYDGSMDTGVAWIKLLEPPAEYIDFIIRHKVKNVIISGTVGSEGGENLARRVLYPGSLLPGHNSGDAFVIFPGNGTAEDIFTLYSRLHDFGDLHLAEPERISDWEAGIVPEQETGFKNSIAPLLQGKFGSLTAASFYQIDNLGGYLTIAFYHKNAENLSIDNKVVRRLALSPYVISHPFWETVNGVVPIVFFQGEPAISVVGNRILNIIKPAIISYFPDYSDIDIANLHVDVMTSRNFGGYANDGLAVQLDAHGFTDYTLGDINVDEVWDLSDGINTWNEKAVTGLAALKTNEELSARMNSLTPLDISDLIDVSRRFPEITFTIF